MVANDTDFQLVAVTYILRKMEINILSEGCNGLEIYQYVQKFGMQKKIDFILLDLDMPILNGFEACKKILQFYNKEKKLFHIEKKKK